MNKYDNLDLNIIRNQIASLTSIKEAKEYILSEEIIFNPLVIKNLLNETREALIILNSGANVSFEGIECNNHLFAKADKNITLNGFELLKISIFHNHCSRLKKQFTQYDKEYSIRDYTDSITLCNDVFDKISTCIDSNGEVYEDCTDELRRLNKELATAEKELMSKAQVFMQKNVNSLQEQSIYLRNDRVTFLIKNSDKNKFSGYTYGTSSSGLASYVEPGVLVELNNRKLQLDADKAQEIERILKHLTYLVSSTAEVYIHNFESLMKLNVVFAKAFYGFNCHGVITEISSDGYFDLKDICHPLININKVVSNSYRLFKPYKGIVISGSNTGGKTVSLKTIGLAMLMSYLGIPVIASKACVPLYSNIFVDIDDNQSIEDSLSTFSAHISNINSILKDADANSLILIDELISGTDPKEAQAISLAIIEKIEKIGASFIITTHFDDVKNYSYNDENILLSSVGFNMETLCPTYKYLENSVGSSNAIEIASRYFSCPSIIERSRYFLDLNQNKQDELMEKLAKQIAENEIIKDELENTRNQNNLLQVELNNKLKAFENEKQSLKQTYENELSSQIEEIINQAKEQLEQINSSKTVEENKYIVKQIENLDLKQKDVIENNDLTIEIGDNVRIKDNEQIGSVLSIRNDDVMVEIRGMKVRTKMSELTKMPKLKKTKIEIKKPKYSRMPMELNLVGERVEDGLVKLEDYLDKANAANMSQVKIIHGIGSGTLRSALRTRMKKIKYIDSIHDGDFYDGGSAVTIVEFKK